MSLKWIIPKEQVDQLVCSSCRNLLSIFPVYLKSDNGEAICGRCTPSDKNSFIQDDAYEAIADFLQFPCCYKHNGCEEELTPHQLKEHELTCLFRKFECPAKMYVRCKWLGPRAGLVDHFEENHPNLFLKKSQFAWNFETSHRANLLLPFETELFIVNKEIDARKENFSCSVQRFGAQSDTVHYNYILKLLSDNKNYWYKLPQRSTESDETTITVTLDSIREKLNNPSSVLVRIEIVRADQGPCESSKEAAANEKNPNLNWEVLNELECPVCYDLMFPPIYQCNDGHSICAACKSAVTNCPLCRTDVMDTRNFTLENLTRFLTYPCKFYKRGCDYVSKSADIKIHGDVCEFGPYPCPMKVAGKCQEQINKSQIVAHMEEKHINFIKRTNRIKVNFKIDESRKTFYFIKFSATIFIVAYQYANRKFHWSVQLMGSAEECRKFKFDIDVVDNSKSNLKYYLKGFCVPVREKIDFNDPRKSVMLTYEQLQPLLTTTLDYYIHVLVD